MEKDNKLTEVSLLLGIIRQYSPDLFRHIVGMIRVLATLQIKK
jgi:hypothetical protein